MFGAVGALGKLAQFAGSGIRPPSDKGERAAARATKPSRSIRDTSARHPMAQTLMSPTTGESWLRSRRLSSVTLEPDIRHTTMSTRAPNGVTHDAGRRDLAVIRARVLTCRHNHVGRMSTR
jgi:hypothetical protein